MSPLVTKALVTLRRFIIGTAFALLSFFIIALIINARDERLSSETKALLQLPANPYQPEQNIYVALAGFHAPPGQSVVATGQSKIAQYNGLVDTMLGDPLTALQSLSSPDPLALQFKGKVDLGSPRDPLFWAAARENGSKVEQWVEQNRELYDRYLALQELSGYFETERASPALNFYAPPTEIRNLFLAKFSLEMQRGDERQRQSALTILRQDMDLWRRMLTGEGNLISKMLAVAYLQNDYLVFSDMIADPKTPIPDNIASFLPEPDSNDWNIGKVFASEFRFSSFVYRQSNVLSASGWQPPDAPDSRIYRWFNKVFLSPLGRWFFKINATQNLDAKLMNQLAEFAAMNPTTFSSQRARYKIWVSENTDLLKLQTIYNPVGKVLVAMGVPAYENYTLRPYDAAALLRLVQLSVEIRRQQIATTDIPAFMKQHPEWSTHPGDGIPFTWNPTTKELAIRTIAKQLSDRRFSVRVWQQPVG